MNYAIVYLMGILAISMAYWYAIGHRHYTGPLVEADINEDYDSQTSNDAFHSSEKVKIEMPGNKRSEMDGASRLAELDPETKHEMQT